MTIHVNLGTIDPRAEKVHIYKAKNAHIALLTPPAPYRTLSPAEAAVVFDDNDYDTNGYVAYRLGIEYKGSINIGPEVIVGTWAETGFGPQELVRGDYAWGYFGRVTASTFITSTDIAGLTSASMLANDVYGKCAYEGRILYFPFADNIQCSLLNLHAQGAMYGMDTKGPAAFTGLPNVVQTKKAQFQGKSYRLRLPRVDNFPTAMGWGSAPNTEAAMAMALMVNNRGPGNNYSSQRMLDDGSSSRAVITNHAVNASNGLMYIPIGGGTNQMEWTTMTPMSVLLEYAPGI